MRKGFINNIIVIICILAMGFQYTAYSQRINTGYIYFGNKYKYQDAVSNTNNSLDTVYPSYFDIDQNGNLKITQTLDEDLIEDMHDKGVKVVPFISNHWDRELGRKALSNRYNLANQIAEAIEKYDLDGVNVDIENVTDADKDDYTDFVKILNEILDNDKEISVAVAANPNGWNYGWHGSYDYEKLAIYSDYIFLMAYDESYIGGPEGPVASIQFVENSITELLKHVDKDKVILGIPFYGRYWKEGESYGGHGASLKRIEETVSKYPSDVVFDESSKSVKATVSKEDGTYVYWYENEESIIEKLKLVEKYDLKGSGSWSLGQEDKSIWNYYSRWLDGEYLVDIYDHWASDSIYSMIDNEIMNGISNMYFAPNDNLTRAQAAVILTRLLEIDDVYITSDSFDDVSKDYWAYNEIELAKKYGLINGKEDNKFYPNDPITRAEISAMLSRLIEDDYSDDNIKFNDVNDNIWSYEYINKMSSMNILKGYEGDMFYPNRNLTRAEMSTIVDRMLKHNIEYKK
ncbi:S-layer homology domain-containing protein [Tepidibacter hydrothermalis]|uniref:S-layer homology domain-containing protein n=1 Tax=Tepidibacter hydrothermalis TaxID=3036126 RepID=A0ABY8EB60_9FIRM|nr:S-layer homology domain-containing protein [Tepidibacter hydrothermalis]WFD10158.1 S-layer homology domain-containing protein [Tepidibacter hydrothermalis]